MREGHLRTVNKVCSNNRTLLFTFTLIIRIVRSFPPPPSYLKTLKDEVRKLSRSPIPVTTTSTSQFGNGSGDGHRISRDSSRPQSPTQPGFATPSSSASSIAMRQVTPPQTPTITTTPMTQEEEVNLKYLRHVILKFLESKPTRVCILFTWPRLFSLRSCGMGNEKTKLY